MAKAPKAPGETPGERANAEVMAGQHAEAKRLRPIQDDTFKRLMDYRQEKLRLEGQANADRQQRMRPGLPLGPNRPNQGVTGAVDRGIALGRGAGDTAHSAERAAIDAKLGLAGIARGDQKTAIAGIDDLARQETHDAITRARNKAGAQAERTALISQGVGVAANLGAGALKPQMSSSGKREAFNQTLPGPQGIALGDDWDYGSR